MGALADDPVGLSGVGLYRIVIPALHGDCVHCPYDLFGDFVAEGGRGLTRLGGEGIDHIHKCQRGQE